ncbi:MAG: ABC transporter substrate-binding protein [Anaerolineales bacterium]|nr:ABC transporter substrate-binding protein [Anaerolineales bacterium]
MGDKVSKRRWTADGGQWLGVIVFAAVAALAMIWVASQQREEDAAWARIRLTGVLRVATDASYPPFSAVDENGDLFGFDIDLAEALGRRLGARVEFENIAYDALLAAVVSGRNDVVISAFIPQLDKLHEAAFTRPYFVSGTVAVVKEEGGRKKEEGGSWADWARGQRLAVEYGAGGDVAARQWARQFAGQQAAGVTVLPQPTAQDALLTLVNGAADAALVDAVTAYEFLRSQPGLALAGPPIEPEPYAIAVSARSRELLPALNRALTEMEADGTLPDLRAKWFGEAAR